jgi:hypothetical protein
MYYYKKFSFLMVNFKTNEVYVENTLLERVSICDCNILPRGSLKMVSGPPFAVIYICYERQVLNNVLLTISEKFNILSSTRFKCT